MEMEEPLYAQFETFFRSHPLPEPKLGPLLVAVSGGVDSMTLLFLTQQLARKRGFLIVAGHVNHGLRPDAELDEQLVMTYCRQLAIPFHSTRIDLHSIPADQRKGIEADARELRYQALRATGQKFGASVVFLAHHAGDQAETVLLRLLRGSSLQGLGGIRPVRDSHGMQFLRPLLKVAKADLYSFATKNKIPFREDSSNTNLEYARNYIRHSLIPAMQHVQPEFEVMMSRLTDLLQEDELWLQHQAEELVARCCLRKGGSYQWDLECFVNYPRPLQRRAIKIILYCLASEEWSSTHVEAVLELCKSSRPSARLSLPGGLSAWREYRHLWMGPRADGKPTETYLSQQATHWKLEAGAQLIWTPEEVVRQTPAWQFVCERWTGDQPMKRDSEYEMILPSVESVVVRRVHTSERIAQLGMSGTKKVQDVFTDLKVPSSNRTRWPGFYVGTHLVWLPGLRRSRDFLITMEHPTGWIISASRTG